MVLSNYQRLIKLAEETFAMHNDASQLQVDEGGDKPAEKLAELTGLPLLKRS